MIIRVNIYLMAINQDGKEIQLLCICHLSPQHKEHNNDLKKIIIIIFYITSTIPIQNLIIDDSIDIGVSNELFNGTYKTSSLTDLSNNLYAKISSNVYTSLSTKQSNITASTNSISIGTSITSLNYNNLTLIKPDSTLFAIKSNVDSSLNSLYTSLNTKQNTISISTPLIKDLSNIIN